MDKLIPTIIQEARTEAVLMLGYMNRKALTKTMKTGFVYFWSRKRKKLWLKGEESGNRLKVKNIFIDCDDDTLLVEAELIGKNACHTGNKTCFYRRVLKTPRG